MEIEFVNAYVENLVNELTELTKFRVLKDTQLKLAEKKIASLSQELEEARAIINKLEASLDKKAKKDNF
jgi:hemerythrin-like domain-containing protein